MKKLKVTPFLAAITFLMAAVALQLWFNKDHYFAMNRAKCSFTMIVFISAMVTALVRPVERGIHWLKTHEKLEKQRMTLLDWCVLVFGVSSLITCLLSEDPALTLVGTKGMFVGAFSYFTGMLVYFVVSRNMKPEKWTIGIMLTAWTLIFVWTLYNQCGGDIWGMHENMRPQDRFGHVSSMGNANAACDAFASVVSFVAIMMLLDNAKLKKILLGLMCLLGLMASYALRNEGVLIGLVAMMPFVIVASFSDTRRVNNALVFLLLVGLSLTFYHFMCMLSIIKELKGLSYTISTYWVGEVITVIAALLLFLRKTDCLKISDRSLRIIRFSLAWTCVILLMGFVTVSIARSFYDPRYGSTRGAIWKGNIWTFRLYTPKEMIFGQGSGMFAKNATLAHTMLLGNEKSTVSFATSHNSLLQALLGNGFIGLGCLLLGLFSMIRDWFADLRSIVLRPVSRYDSISNTEYDEVIRIASFVAVIGYFGSSLVESTYPHTVMLLFVMLALYRSCYFVHKHKGV